MSKFEIHITTWVGSQMGASHYYGKIYIPIERRNPSADVYDAEIELEHVAPEFAPPWWYTHGQNHGPYRTSQYANPTEVIQAGTEWFLLDEKYVKPGDKLVVSRRWRNWIGKALHYLRHAPQPRKDSDVLRPAS